MTKFSEPIGAGRRVYPHVYSDYMSHLEGDAVQPKYKYFIHGPKRQCFSEDFHQLVAANNHYCFCFCPLGPISLLKAKYDTCKLATA